MILEDVLDDEPVGFLGFLPADFDGLVRVVVLAQGQVIDDVVGILYKTETLS